MTSARSRAATATRSEPVRSETTPGPTRFGFVVHSALSNPKPEKKTCTPLSESWSVSRVLLWSVRFNTRSRARVCWRPENMLHHMLPAEPNCLHSTRQSIHSRQLKSNFHSMRLAPDCELGERGRRATSSWPKPHATEAERPCAYDAVRARPLCTDRSAAIATAVAQLSQGSLARARSRRRA